MKMVGVPLLLAFAAFLAVIAGQKIPRACSTPETSVYPFCNTSLPLDTRIWDLISRINDTEKPPLLTARMSPAGNISRIGLPEYDWGANCIHGVQSRCGTKCPTSFSNPIGLSASFNMSIVRQMGAIIGLELRSLWLQGVGENHPNNLPHLGLDCWSPNINIARDPRWGRIMETSGEDPYLSGQFGTAYTIGLQNGTLDPRYLQAVVTLKHWDAYSLEDSDGVTRYDFNAIVSLYDFANTYFPAFRASVTQGNAKGVMCSYNAINGVPTCASQFLNNTLRGTWGFDGYVTSDSDSVACIVNNHHYTATAAEASAVAILAGTDIDSGNTYLDNLIPATQQKLINISNIDLALYRTLKLRFELGLFDPIEDQPYWNVSADVVNTPATQAFNVFATQSTFVLLKNDGPILPIPRGKNIAIIGPHGNATSALVGNYLGQICPSNDFSCVTSPLQAITQANTGGTTTYAEGCAINSQDTSGFEQAITNAKLADYILLFIGIDTTVEGEMNDRTNTTLPGVQPELAQEILALGKPVAIVLLNGGPLSLDSLAVTAPSILEVFYPGYQGGVAIASAIFGDYNPGGKLPYTVYHTDYLNQVNMTNMDMSLAPGRTYKYYTGTPIWPFGYGLSYTQFELAWNGSSSAPHYTISNLDDTPATYAINVTNIGAVAGDEVVQIYMKPPNDTLIIKQLIAFQRVHLLAGKSATVEIQINRESLIVGNQNGDLVCSAGDYAITVTNGVSLVLDTVLTVKGTSEMILDKLYA